MEVADFKVFFKTGHVYGMVFTVNYIGRHSEDKMIQTKQYVLNFMYIKSQTQSDWHNGIEFICIQNV